MLWPKPVHMAIWMTNLLDVNKLGQGKPDKVMAECHSVSSRKKKRKKLHIYIFLSLPTWKFVLHQHSSLQGSDGHLYSIA